MTIKIAAYIRVSTDDQKIDSQLDAIKKYCELKDWPAPVLFIDHGESGKKDSRPQLDELLKRIKEKEFNSLVVFKFDRLSRSTIQLIQLMELFKAFDVNFISLGESIDTTTPAGKMIFGIFAVLAEFERENIVERVKAGIKAAKARGTHCGRDNFKLTKDQIDEIKEKYQNGVKQFELAKEYNVNKGYISRLVRSQK